MPYRISWEQPISIRDLSHSNYGEIICFPKFEDEEFERRLGELRALGITAICPLGKVKIKEMPVLGKGCVGIVIAAYRGDKLVALKTKRTDVREQRIIHEAQMLQIANTVNVGPRLLGFSENFLVIEFVEGSLIRDWVENESMKEGSDDIIRQVLTDILHQCWKLDNLGLDHGELSRAEKHIIVNGKNMVHIVDFETASIARKPSNVTSVCNSLFLRGVISEALGIKIGRIEQSKLISALRNYKKSRTYQNFKEILKACRL